MIIYLFLMSITVHESVLFVYNNDIEKIKIKNNYIIILYKLSKKQNDELTENNYYWYLYIYRVYQPNTSCAYIIPPIPVCVFFNIIL